MCIKEQYATEELARGAAKGLSERKKYTVRYYYCSECGQYHLATAKGRKKFNGRDNTKYPFRYHGKKKKK